MFFWILSAWVAYIPLRAHSAEAGVPEGPTENKVSIRHIESDRRGGKAYRLEYVVLVPIDVYWRFKTDFDNDFLAGNKFIREHRFISRRGNTAITENRYTYSPAFLFRWQTTVYPAAHRLEFVLLNPLECSQRFHYGVIRLEPIDEGTRVSQEAYFDFFGAALWAYYPWGGGMADFLTYIANWEQEFVLGHKGRYSGEIIPSEENGL